MSTSKKKVSYRDIARELGVTAMTVSLAMRNHPSIPDATRQRVRNTAERLGYRPDPKLVEIMQYMNRRKQLREYPVLCFLNIWKARTGWRKSIYINRLFKAAAARANALGTELQEFWLCEKGMTARRMVDILKTRNINGILLPPLPPFEEGLDFPFEKFCVVTTSYTAEAMGFNMVTNNRHQIIRLALQKVKEFGYKRIGLVIDQELDRRSNHDVHAHFMLFQSQQPTADHVDILYGDNFDSQRLAKWYHDQRPEVVLSMNNSVYDWLREAGLAVPQQVGFVSLSNSPDYPVGYSGVDERSDLVGAAAVDMLTAHLIRNEIGRPESRKLTLLEGSWLDGNTLIDRRPPAPDLPVK